MRLKLPGEIMYVYTLYSINNSWLKNIIYPLKNKKFAGVYGRQEPMPYSSNYDKRDLMLLFGLDRKIQSKDPFFHNANSAFLKKIWKNYKIDEKTTNIEDRIWVNQVLSKGYKIL